MLSDHCLRTVANETIELHEVTQVFKSVNPSFCNHLNINIISSATQQEIAKAKNSDDAIGLFRTELRNSRVSDKLNKVIQVLMEMAPMHAKEIEQYYHKQIGTHKKTCAKCKEEFGQPGEPTVSTAPDVTASRSSDESPKMDVCVTTVNRDEIEQYLHDENAYKVKHRIRGRALIFNIDKFENKTKDRHGSSYDADNLVDLFEQLQFKSILVQSPSKEEILKLLTDESKRTSDCDAFVLCALSHGDQCQGQDFICGRDYQFEEHCSDRENQLKKDCSDRNGVKIRKDICAKFESEAWKGKPKIFIIQACRGDIQTTGSPQVTETTDKIGEEGQMPYNFKKHEKADFLIAHATVSGYASWRMTKSGTWFVRSLVEVFAEQAHEYHIEDMLKEVRRKVESRKTDEGCIQMTENTTSLTKDFYFLPGYNGTK